MELTPELKEAWLRNGIASRLFPSSDTCEEIVNGHPDKIFIQVRQGETTWKLVGVRSTVPDSPKPKAQTKRQQRYAQYE